jgi:hypothetical protein
MDLKEILCEDMDGTQLVQGRDQWWALVNMIMNFWVPLKAGNFLTR